MEFKCVQPIEIQERIQSYLQDENELKKLRLRTYFQLNIYIPENEEELREKYKERIEKHNKKTMDYLIESSGDYDCGFDLIMPDEKEIKEDIDEAEKVSHKIKCSMIRWEPFFLNPPPGRETKAVQVQLFNNYPSGYYLYMRSSTGTKTPLRMANLTGIIDPGYRGEIIAAFDNNSKKSYTIEKHSRLTQICGPDISHPIYVVLVDNIENLGITLRGDGGFGSTGN